MQKALEKHGFKTAAAENGEEGVRKAKEMKPDLIFMDIVMPGVNGYQATRMLINDPETSLIPIIMVTTKGQETDRVWGLRQGAVDYLVKPVSAQALVEKAISIAATALVDNRDVIKATVAKKSSRFIPKWVDGIVADKIMSGVSQLLDEMRNPGHPWRVELGTAIERLIKDLAENPEMIGRGEELKAEMLGNPMVAEQVGKLWIRIETRIGADSTSYIDPLSDGLERGLSALGGWMAQDEKIKTAINQWVAIALLRLVAPRRAEIGNFIAQVVERWDSETLVNRLELQVGRDLQYIRINGTLVGGLVGLIIFSAKRFLL